MRALQIAAIGANPGENGASYRKLVQQLETKLGAPQQAEPGDSTLIPGLTPFTSVVSDGSIEALRDRQRQNAERNETKRRAAWTANRRGENPARDPL